MNESSSEYVTFCLCVHFCVCVRACVQGCLWLYHDCTHVDIQMSIRPVKKNKKGKETTFLLCENIEVCKGATCAFTL